MIYGLLDVGQYFEPNVYVADECKNLVNVITPGVRTLFVFTQMYFIFLNIKVCTHNSQWD